MDPHNQEAEDTENTETLETSPIVEGREYSVAHVYETVWNQGNTPCCLAVAAANMITIIYRQLGSNYSNVEASPLRLLRSQVHDGMIADCVYELKQLIVGEGKGIEDMSVHPVDPFDVKVPTEVPETDDSKERFFIDSLENLNTQDDILQALVLNFCQIDPAIPAVPIIGRCSMEGFTKNMALRTSKTNPHTQSFTGDAPDHAVLITGIYILRFDGENLQISVQLKNSWGATWGNNGYCWVTPGFLTSIDLPIKGASLFIK